MFAFFLHGPRPKLKQQHILQHTQSMDGLQCRAVQVRTSGRPFPTMTTCTCHAPDRRRRKRPAETVSCHTNAHCLRMRRLQHALAQLRCGLPAPWYTQGTYGSTSATRSTPPSSSRDTRDSHFCRGLGRRSTAMVRRHSEQIAVFLWTEERRPVRAKAQSWLDQS